MKQLKVIHDLFLFEDDLFQNGAEIFRNGRCTGIGQNKTFVRRSGTRFGFLLVPRGVIRPIFTYFKPDCLNFHNSLSYS